MYATRWTTVLTPAIVLTSLCVQVSEAHRTLPPQQRRFVQRDPILDNVLVRQAFRDKTSYSYVHNRPTVGLDPSGLFCIPGTIGCGPASNAGPTFWDNAPCVVGLPCAGYSRLCRNCTALCGCLDCPAGWITFTQSSTVCTPIFFGTGTCVTPPPPWWPPILPLPTPPVPNPLPFPIIVPITWGQCVIPAPPGYPTNVNC